MMSHDVDLWWGKHDDAGGRGTATSDDDLQLA
jgi:hypothetical protein